jgi:hypothetical protein
MELKRTLGADLTVPLRPQVSLDEPSVVLAATKGEDQPSLGYCPMCGTYSVLCRPDRGTIASYVQATAMPCHASLIADREATCSLCSISSDPAARKAAVFLGHIYYLIGTEDSPSQGDINRSYWEVIDRSSRRFRLAARELLRDQLFFEERCKSMELPSERLSAREIEEAERHLFNLMGRFSFKRLKSATRDAMMGTYGVHFLLENADRLKPEWLGSERYLLSPNGVEYYRSIVAGPMKKNDMIDPAYVTPEAIANAKAADEREQTSA